MLRRPMMLWSSSSSWPLISGSFGTYRGGRSAATGRQGAAIPSPRCHVGDTQKESIRARPRDEFRGCDLAPVKHSRSPGPTRVNADLRQRRGSATIARSPSASHSGPPSTTPTEMPGARSRSRVRARCSRALSFTRRLCFNRVHPCDANRRRPCRCDDSNRRRHPVQPVNLGRHRNSYSS